MLWKAPVKIEVILEGKTYDAKVLALDTKNDLAVIRIRAAGLPHLQILDSDRVRLAEEVRAFGFPLTTHLGESIKITRGTVSGISQQQDSKVFQLDVNVNPGNSGGPLVNERGQVAGVVSALLSGEDISNVSFAVTSNDVRRLMDRDNLRYEAADSAAAVMSGPDLAEKVRKSVALIKVTSGPGGIGIAEKKVVKFENSCRMSLTTVDGVTRQPLGKGVDERGVVLIDSTGEIAYCDGQIPIPGDLGLIATLGLQPLADDESQSWQSSRLMMIQERKSIQIASLPSASDLYSPGYDPYFRRRRPRPQTVSTVKYHPAIEMTSYEIQNTSGDLVNIKKTLDLKTIDAGEDGLPYMKVSGNGSLQFDKQRGFPKSLDFSGTIAVTHDGKRIPSLPFKLSFTSVGSRQATKRAAVRAAPARRIPRPSGSFAKSAPSKPPPSAPPARPPARFPLLQVWISST